MAIVKYINISLILSHYQPKSVYTKSITVKLPHRFLYSRDNVFDKIFEELIPTFHESY